jgi:preprotein translocase subunit YajC
VAGFAAHTTSLIGRAHRTMGPLLLLILLFAIAWVVLILPKQRELKRHNALVASLEVGDEVMTGSGFYGTLLEIDDDTVLVQLAPGIEVKLARRAVAAKVVAPAEGATDAATGTADTTADITTADITTDAATMADAPDADEDVDR